MKVAKILVEKKDNKKVYTIHAEATIKEAARKLTDHNIGALIVIADKDNPTSYAGILTERMIIVNLWKHENFLQMPIKEIMSKQLTVVTAENDINDVMNIMTQNRFRYVSVWEKNKIIGLLSIGDIIKSLRQEAEIKTTYLSKIAECGTYGNKVY